MSPGMRLEASAASEVVATDESELTNAIGTAGTVATTIELDADITLTSALIIPANADITLTSGSGLGAPYKLIGAAGASTINVVTGGMLTLDGINVTHDPGDTEGEMHGVYISSGGKLILKSGEISGNKAALEPNTLDVNNKPMNTNLDPGNYGAGVYISNGGLFTMNGGEIHDNKANGHGGGVLISRNSSFEMNSGNIHDNYATGDAGGVGIDQPTSSFTMNGGFIRDNISAAGGGAVHNNGTFLMNYGILSGNSAPNGGAVYNNEYMFPTGYFRMIDGEIIDNTATNYGGGIANGITYNGTLDIRGGLISGNKALDGAGVYSQFSFTMSGGIIENNRATDTNSWGGGILSCDSGTSYSYPSANFVMSGGTVRNNYADYGAGIYIYEYGRPENFTMSGSSITGNVAAINGGGLYYNSNTTFSISDSAITGNTAKNGGGIYIDTSTYANSGGKLSGHVDLSGNIATDSGNGQGGGIYTQKFSNLTITGPDVKFSGNTADYTCDRDSTNDGVYASNILGMDGNWTAPLTQGYNNFDINQTIQVGIPRQYVLTYNANGGANPPPPIVSEEGADAVAAAQGSMGYTGYVFTGWNTEKDATGDAYAANDDIAMNGNVTLYAIWEKAAPIVQTSYTVTYDQNGSGNGMAPADKTRYPAGATATVLGQGGLAWDGYTFLGWSKDKDATSPQYDGGSKLNISGNITLYAIWKKDVPATTPESTPAPNGTGTNNTTVPTSSGGHASHNVASAVEKIKNIAVSAYEAIDETSNDISDVTNDDTSGAASDEVNTAPIIPPVDTGSGALDNEISGSTEMPYNDNTIQNKVIAQLTSENVPIFNVGGVQIPLYGGSMNDFIWALVNLILCVIGILIAIITSIRSVRKKNERRPPWIAIAVIMGVAGVVVFLLTENMKNPMALFDNWTIVNAILFVIGVAGARLAIKQREQKSDEEKK